MNFETRFLDMKEAGSYLGQTYRWMQRHWVDLVKSGVEAYRVPKDAVKGRLIFKKETLDRYIETCQLKLPD